MIGLKTLAKNDPIHNLNVSSNEYLSEESKNKK